MSYNQLYLALPVEIQRSGGSEKDLGPLFMLASVLIIAFQLPLARLARRAGAVRILPLGFLLLSAAFASVAMFAASLPPVGWLRLLACGVSGHTVDARPNAAGALGERFNSRFC